MLIWAILAAMTAFAVLAVLRPLTRERASDRIVATDADIYRTQLAEIDRDVARGILISTEAQHARNEAARRLLAVSERATSAAVLSAPQKRLAILIAIVAMPLAAIGLYLPGGSPVLPDQPLSARLRLDPAKLGVDEAVQRIEAHLAANPSDGRGYELLAPIYMRMGRSDDAVRAYGSTILLLGETPIRLADYGEALTAQAGGVVTGAGQQQFERALILDPIVPKARYFLAVKREQDGDAAGAKTAFEDLARIATPDAPWLPAVLMRVAALAMATGTPVDPQLPIPAAAAPAGLVPGAPSGPGADAIASLPPTERRDAIKGMVAGLDARLAANGGPLDDWTRLLRSRIALGERDEAQAVLARAASAFAGDAVRRAELSATARELGLDVSGLSQ